MDAIFIVTLLNKDYLVDEVHRQDLHRGPTRSPSTGFVDMRGDVW